ncbi:unnamed protein product [Allacma fusca]|uniref:Uncharacterized protein n=1 Tax=Allacma fusca TaxID=39272 RepID=A0A8J2PEB5_9HEXA|nr:unnamed protein product [Allacma fusca]
MAGNRFKLPQVRNYNVLFCHLCGLQVEVAWTLSMLLHAECRTPKKELLPIISARCAIFGQRLHWQTAKSHLNRQINDMRQVLNQRYGQADVAAGGDSCLHWGKVANSILTWRIKCSSLTVLSHVQEARTLHLQNPTTDMQTEIPTPIQTSVSDEIVLIQRQANKTTSLPVAPVVPESIFEEEIMEQPDAGNLVLDIPVASCSRTFIPSSTTNFIEEDT